MPTTNVDDIKRNIEDALWNIKHYRETHPNDKMYNYDDGRYDAYMVVLGWIDQMERSNQ